jgi:hypothetical protein
MPDEKDKNDRMMEEKKDQEEEKTDDQVDHHIPVPPGKKKHGHKHWEHLPESKRKPVRSFKSPGRK